MVCNQGLTPPIRARRWSAVCYRYTMKIFDGYNVIGAGKNLGLSLSREGQGRGLLRLLYAYRSRRRSREKLSRRLRRRLRPPCRGAEEVHQGGDRRRVGHRRKRRQPHRRERCAEPESEGDRSDLLGRGDPGARPPRPGPLDAQRRLPRPRRGSHGGGAQIEKPDRPTAGEVQEWLALFGGGEDSD